MGEPHAACSPTFRRTCLISERAPQDQRSVAPQGARYAGRATDSTRRFDWRSIRVTESVHEEYGAAGEVLSPSVHRAADTIGLPQPLTRLSTSDAALHRDRQTAAPWSRCPRWRRVRHADERGRAQLRRLAAAIVAPVIGLLAPGSARCRGNGPGRPRRRSGRRGGRPRRRQARAARRRALLRSHASTGRLPARRTGQAPGGDDLPLQPRS
jgi:hypothetical protein